MQDVVAVASVLIALTALGIALEQTYLNRKALQAETYLKIEELAEATEVEAGFAAIALLKNYESYDAFIETESPETRDLIRSTVHFLNILAQLISNRYIGRQAVWSIYFFRYRIGYRKLSTWWLEGERREHPRHYLSFECESERVAKVPKAAIDVYDKKHYGRMFIDEFN